MSKSKGSKEGGNVAAKIICLIVGLILIAGAVVGTAYLARHTNGFANSFKTFYVETGGKRYYNDGNVTLRMNSITSFKCGYMPNVGNAGDLQTYDLKITSYETDKTAFNYTLDGSTYAFLGGEDYTKCFDVTESKEGFTITNVKDTPIDIIQRKHNGHKVGGKVPDLQQAYFKLTVTASDGKQSVSFLLKLEYVMLDLDPGGIIL